MSFHTPNLKERILTISPYVLIVLLTLFIWLTLASPTVQEPDFIAQRLSSDTKSTL